MYWLLVLLLASCSHMSNEDLYYSRIYAPMCEIKLDVSDETNRRQQLYYDSMCNYYKQIKK